MILFYQTVHASWFRIKLQLTEINQIWARTCQVGYNQSWEFTHRDLLRADWPMGRWSKEPVAYYCEAHLKYILRTICFWNYIDEFILNSAIFVFLPRWLTHHEGNCSQDAVIYTITVVITARKWVMQEDEYMFIPWTSFLITGGSVWIYSIKWTKFKNR